jgi:hypothetical protein
MPLASALCGLDQSFIPQSINYTPKTELYLNRMLDTCGTKFEYKFNADVQIIFMHKAYFIMQWLLLSVSMELCLVLQAMW